jgi:uncharacterized protein YndB with AHSA1/START domain
MPLLEKEITVKAPVDRVFAFVDDPVNLPQIWPSLYEIKDVKTLPNGGHAFDWIYNMAGKRIAGTVETLEHVANKRIVDKAVGDAQSVFTWEFAGRNGTTTVRFQAQYDMPLPYFEKKDEPFLMQRNDYEVTALLGNLKARFES